jgi:hypothetical protein
MTSALKSLKIQKITDEGMIENPTGVGERGEEKLDDTLGLGFPNPNGFGLAAAMQARKHKTHNI